MKNTEAWTEHMKTVEEQQEVIEVDVMVEDFVDWETNDLISHRRAICELMQDQVDAREELDHVIFHKRQAQLNCVDVVLRKRGIAI